VHYGRVGYVEGGGIDAPLALFKESEVVYPHADWRGVYDSGTCLPGPCSAALDFPGGTGVASAYGPNGVDPDGAAWYGTVVWAQLDATGKQYKRNRYLDPTTGRFTQEDPIGLAGGVNLFGYAGGDPVNFSDPFGLCPPIDKCLADLRSAAGAILGAVAQYVGTHPEIQQAIGDYASSPGGGGRWATSVTLSRSRFPASAAHIEEAQAAGHASVLTVGRASSAARRREALAGIPTKAGMDRDEYPPAMFTEGGRGASVKHLPNSDNRGAGACIGAQCRGLPEGSKVRITIVHEE